MQKRGVTQPRPLNDRRRVSGIVCGEIENERKTGTRQRHDRNVSRAGDQGPARYAESGRHIYHRITHTGMDIKMQMRWHTQEL